jgi:hypothetical protein
MTEHIRKRRQLSDLFLVLAAIGAFVAAGNVVQTTTSRSEIAIVAGILAASTCAYSIYVLTGSLRDGA